MLEMGNIFSNQKFFDMGWILKDLLSAAKRSGV